jgi:hypothetical protein
MYVLPSIWPPAGVMTMLDVVANHVGPVGQNYSLVTPFNSSQHYHHCLPGCATGTCDIPQSAYDTINRELIETCKLMVMPQWLRFKRSLPAI